MPPTYIVVTISIVFVAVVAFLQFFYWTWIASADRREAELMRRLGTTQEQAQFDELFQSLDEDATARRLGSFGTHIKVDSTRRQQQDRHRYHHTDGCR